jgi:hypothetical protein
MVSVKTANTVSTGVGQVDYGLAISQTLHPVRNRRDISSGAIAYPAGFCNVDVVNQFGWQVMSPVIAEATSAPLTPVFYYDLWASVNKSVTIKMNLHEYLTQADVDNATNSMVANPYRDYGGVYGIGTAEMHWTTGLQLTTGRFYTINVRVIDPTNSKFILWVGMAGCWDVTPQGKVVLAPGGPIV